MRIQISSASTEAINKKYKESARKVTEYLASKNCELVWGSGNSSIMGICYESFSKYNCKMHGVTSFKYKDEIKDLPKADHEICDDTLILKKHMFDKADMFLMLPGGTGTVSEFFTYLEEIRSNDSEKLLVVYDEYDHFKKVWELIDDLIERSFNKTNIYDNFSVAHNMEEFEEVYEAYSKKLKMTM